MPTYYVFYYVSIFDRGLPAAMFLSFAPLCVLLHSNETEGTALASAAHVGKDRIVAYLLSVGASANGSVERHKMKVAIHN